MFTKLSKIIPFSSSIIAFTLTMILSHSILFSLINMIAIFLMTFIPFAAMLLVNAKILGNKFNKEGNLLNPKYVAYYNDLAAFSVFWLGLKVKASGLEKLDKNKTYVFYSNHQGFTDIIVHQLVLKDFPHSSLYKQEHDNNVIGPIAKGLGGVALNRDNDREAVKEIIHVIKKVNNGRNFMIYPEGHRSKGLSMREYHPGSFKVVEKSTADLAIIMIDGAYHKSTYIPFFPTKIYWKVIDVISNEDVKKYETTELAKLVHDKCEQELNNSRKMR